MGYIRLVPFRDPRLRTLQQLADHLAIFRLRRLLEVITEMVDRFADGLNMKKDDFSTLHPIGRIGRVDEVANAVLWLCSGKASFVTGHSLIVDGGFTCPVMQQRFESFQVRFA